MAAITLLVYFCLLLFCQSNGSAKDKVRNFPKDFMFGASTSSYQVEGGWDADGKLPSSWDEYIHSNPSLITGGTNADEAADSYHQYKRDVEIMNELGLDFYRFSLSWSRILPQGFPHQINQAGINYYNNLINEMLKYNIQPMITIYHWDLPSNLDKLGGLTNPYFADWLEDFARVAFEAFGDRVKHWITVNEPNLVCFEGYGGSYIVPFFNMSGTADYMCSKNILLAHARVYHLYDKNYRKTQKGKVGLSISSTWFEPISHEILDERAAELSRMFEFGQHMHPIFTKDGDFPAELKKRVAVKSAKQGFSKSRLPELSPTEIEYLKGSADFLGLNSYSAKLVYFVPEGTHPIPSSLDDVEAMQIADPIWPQAPSFWLQEVPWGFYKLLKDIRLLYGNPLTYITENGWSTSGGLVDDERIRYYRNYLGALLDAIEEGSNVKGYCVWSMIDTFEWTHGFTTKFGLYEVNYTSPEKTRTPRKSAYVYREIIRTRSLDPEFTPKEFQSRKYLSSRKSKSDETNNVS